MNIGKINRDFDAEILMIDKLMHVPWIGEKYHKSEKGIYVVGESHYKWSNTPEVEEEINNPNFTRNVVYNQGLFHLSNWNQSGKVGKLFRNVERSIYLKKSVTDIEREKLWQSVAFSNLVNYSLPSRHERPSYEDYYQGWKNHRSLYKILQPDIVVVLGLERKKLDTFTTVFEENILSSIQSYSSIGKSTPKVFRVQLELDSPTKFVFIRHPSSFYSWKLWGEFLNDHLL